jgi:hypothetical protein
MPTVPQGAITATTLWPPVVAEDLFARFFDEAATMTGAIPDAVPLVELPDYTVWAGPHLTQQLAAHLMQIQRELEARCAPAVETERRPGFFPLNKFSSPRLAITAVRKAATESKGDNTGRVERLAEASGRCGIQRERPQPEPRRTGTDGRRLRQLRGRERGRVECPRHRGPGRCPSP